MSSPSDDTGIRLGGEPENFLPCMKSGFNSSLAYKLA